MTSRERMLAALRRTAPDRVPIMDSPWVETVRRWNDQGLPHGISPDDWFGYDMVRLRFDQSPLFEIKTLSKDNEYIVETTPYGGVRKNHRTFDTTPEVVDWAIKNKADWNRIKARLSADFAPDESRVDWVSMRECFNRARSEEKCIALGSAVGYDHLQSYIKSDALLELMVEDPGWIRDMVATVADLTVRMAELFIRWGFTADVGFLFNDMAYRNAPLFSPRLYRECILESDRMLCDFFHAHDMPVIYHTDGDIRMFIPDLIAAGIDCLQPLEAKANMDVRELKREFGDRLAFMGNIDVRAMADPEPNAIEDEVRTKIAAAKEGGGYIYHSDHSVPSNVTFQQYTRTIDLVRKYGSYS